MSLNVETTSCFRKQRRLMKRQGKDMNRLFEVISILANGEDLPSKYRDHRLRGNFSRCRECHIEPDWLLIYRISGNLLELVETGSHSDLFS